jgi:glycosyltransferase involved in cell wall biosynthesis
MQRVSVVMATYNGANFLQAQLESISRQTWPVHELIVGDDGSSDDTLQRLDLFAKNAPFPVVVVNHDHFGFANNFLSALEHASGHLVAFSDQDDVWHPRKLEVSVNSLTRLGGSLYVHLVQNVGADLRRRILPQPLPRMTRFVAPYTGNPYSLLAGNSCIFRANLLEGVDWRTRPTSQFGPQPTHHDEFIYLLAAMRGGFTRGGARLIKYRQHGNNAAGAAPLIPLHALSFEARRTLVRQRIEAGKAWLDYFPRYATPATRDVAQRYFAAAIARQESRERLLLEESMTRRALMWTRFVVTGAYRQNKSDGLGWRALMQDAYLLPRTR